MSTREIESSFKCITQLTGTSIKSTGFLWSFRQWIQIHYCNYGFQTKQVTTNLFQNKFIYRRIGLAFFWGGGGATKGALHKEKSRNINLWKTSDCVKNKSNFENRIAIHFAFVE